MQGKIKKINKMLVGREISAAELTDKYIDYIQKNDTVLNSYTEKTFDEAKKTAAEVDRKIAAGEEISVLAGVPMTVKDCICTKDVSTTCASKILEGYKPVFDAFAVEQLKYNDAVMLGKTNMDEFAMGSTCETSCYGATKNPHNTECVPGGSSGGVAAAVAADMAVYGLGSDTGGSVRQPASFCGCVGLKPTYGAVSGYGLIAYASSLDQIGILAQNTEDAAIAFDAVNKYDFKDATCSDKPRKSAYEMLGEDIKGLKIGILTNLYEGLNPEIHGKINDAIDFYTRMGAEVKEISINQFDLALPVYYILACAEASSNLSRYDGVRYGHRTKEFSDFNDMVCKTRDEGFGVEVKRRIMLGNYVLSSGYFDAYYKKAQRMREVISDGFANAFKDVDAIITPTVASTAFKLGEMSGDPVAMYLTDMCTVTVNICGLPAVSIPCGFDSRNMPIGMQLIGNKFSEGLLLNAAYAFEDAKQNEIYSKPQVGGDCFGI